MWNARNLFAVLTLCVMSAAVTTRGEGQAGALRRRAEEAARKKLADAAKKAAADSAKAKSGADSADARAGADSVKSEGAAAPVAGAPAKADPKVWENYDFVPGNRVIFFTDFSEDKVGNFARGLKYKSGPVEVVERGGVKVLRATGRSEILIPVGKKLPERFTLEIDLIAPAVACCPSGLMGFEGGADMDRGNSSADVYWAAHQSFIIGGGQNLGASTVRVPEAMQPSFRGKVAHVRVLMDGPYFKMYSNERRLYNIPELGFKRDSVIRVFLEGSEADGLAVYLTGIRVAESETDVLYDALTAKGRWVTQGILFATGKAELQPESRPVLKEIATTLQQHADLKILIEGHTDNVGAAASNLTLSDARATGADGGG
jgi:OmpA-OmpF porin, OOP family